MVKIFYLLSLINYTSNAVRRAVKRIGVSNFYASHLTKLLVVCREFNWEKPIANEIQINLYVQFEPAVVTWSVADPPFSAIPPRSG